MKQATTFDVVIVGSGAGGGTLAAHLARQGVRVALVEGGPRVNTRTDFNTHALPFEFPNRQIPAMRPGKEGFDTERSRGVGGKTMLWNAVALRFSERDFKGRTFEGAGEDWPCGPLSDRSGRWASLDAPAGGSGLPEPVMLRSVLGVLGRRRRPAASNGSLPSTKWQPVPVHRRKCSTGRAGRARLPSGWIDDLQHPDLYVGREWNRHRYRRQPLLQTTR